MTDSLKLHCLHTIIGSNGANRPGSEPTLAELGVDLKDAETLVASGAARWAEPAAEAPAAFLAGVQDADGTVRDLSELKKAELLEIAKGMEIAGCEAMTKPELIAAIQAEEVELVEEPAAAEAGADAAAAADAPAADAAAATADENGQA